MKKIAITGASGRVGSALAAGLASRYRLTLMSRSIDGTDLSQLDSVAERLAGHDAVVHLAWQYVNSKRTRTLGYFGNLEMSRNVLRAARRAGVARAVMASSVHADYFYDWDGPGYLPPDRPPRGNDVYGSAKVLVEELGRELSDETLRVASVRYGAVTRDGLPHPSDAWERRVWLSHGDLCALLIRIIEAEDPPISSLLTAVSDNEGRVHDTANPFGWVPRDRAEALTPSG